MVAPLPWASMTNQNADNDDDDDNIHKNVESEEGRMGLREPGAYLCILGAKHDTPQFEASTTQGLVHPSHTQYESK